MGKTSRRILGCSKHSPTYVDIEVVAQMSHRMAIWYSAATSGVAPPSNCPVIIPISSAMQCDDEQKKRSRDVTAAFADLIRK